MIPLAKLGEYHYSASKLRAKLSGHLWQTVQGFEEVRKNDDGFSLFLPTAGFPLVDACSNDEFFLYRLMLLQSRMERSLRRTS